MYFPAGLLAVLLLLVCHDGAQCLKCWLDGQSDGWTVACSAGHESMLANSQANLTECPQPGTGETVRCYVNFGSLLVRAPVTIGGLLGAHEVRSDDITFHDEKTVFIKNFFYDGLGPDAYFMADPGDEFEYDEYQTIKVPDETGSLDVLGAYNGKDITLTLPGDTTWYDVDWLSVYCIHFAHDFAHIRIPKPFLRDLNPIERGCTTNDQDCKKQTTTCCTEDACNVGPPPVHGGDTTSSSCLVTWSIVVLAAGSGVAAMLV